MAGVAAREQRRVFLERTVPGLGAAALAGLLGGETRADGAHADGAHVRVPRARRVISLFMHGGPSQLELFDYKPGLRKLHGSELPSSMRATQRLTGMTSGQSSFPIAAPLSRFVQCGGGGAWVGEYLPWTARVVDRLAIVRSLYTEAINHDPAVTLLQTGHQQPGRPSFGAWASYGLGSESADLPAFVVMISRGSAARPADPLYARLWGSGFLPSNHQGTLFRAAEDPVLYLQNPAGISGQVRRGQLDLLRELNQRQLEREGDGETAAQD